MLYLLYQARNFRSYLAAAGFRIELGIKVLRRLHHLPKRRRWFLDQLFTSGIMNVHVVLLVGLFVGMIVSLQTGIELARFGQQDQIGVIVAASMAREMGPFITAVILAATVGSSLAAELGTMSVSDELSALEVLSVDQVSFLVLPRVVALAIIVAIPVAWPMLKDYQQERVLTFLSPERDPGDKGYQILQSKIALGSGGTFGRGFMKGTQSHLNFLPERQTDFIFTMLAEEFGLVGGLGLLGLYALLLAYGTAIAMRSTSQFGRLLAMGVTIMVFLYVFINIAMVMGLLPVVGLPLPLISRGGTAMLAVLGGFGLVISVYVHRDTRIGRHGDSD